MCGLESVLVYNKKFYNEAKQSSKQNIIMSATLIQAFTHHLLL